VRPGFSPVVVPGEGPVGAPLMLVGEQPGDQEDRQRRPFVGPAGHVLDQCLAEAGLKRDALFLTNAVKCFKYAPRGKRRLHRTPTASDVSHARWWLEEEIRLVGPRVLVALGGTALLALTGQRTLKPVRGQLLPWHERQMLATVHPSYLLRLRDEPDRTQERTRFIADLARAAQSADMA